MHITLYVVVCMFYVKYAECLRVNVMNVMKSVYLTVKNALSAKQWQS